jgi:hypothetical protein
MNHFSKIHAIMLISVVLLLSGCFDVSYRIILKSDYSGTFESQMKFGIDAWKALENDTLSYSRDSLSYGVDTSRARLIHYAKTLEGDYILIDWHFAFNDIGYFAEIHDRIQGGELTLIQEDSLMVLTFSIDAPEIDDADDAEIASMMFEGHSCFFDAELPKEIVAVDEKGTILKDITMASWEFSLEEWIKGQDIEAVVKFKE